MRARLFAIAALAVPALAFACGASAAPERSTAPERSIVLDDFSRPTLWKAQASDGVVGTSRASNGALRLDYDFTKGSGYAFLRRELPLELPANYALSFRIRGKAAANALELKLVDASGDNVWWHRKADYVPPGAWTTIRVKRRQIDFAWGPTQDKVLRRAAAVEFVVAAGTGGGKGWIEIDDLTLTPLPAPPATPPAIVASAPAAVDGDVATAHALTRDAPLVLDLGYQREFGGLRLSYEAARTSAYVIATSADRRTWSTSRHVATSLGRVAWIKLPETEARYIRIAATDPGLAVAEVRIEPIAFGATDNAFVTAIARESPGTYPRGFAGSQNYWTLVATPEGGNSGLIDENGAVEIGRGGPSVEASVDVRSARNRDGEWVAATMDQIAIGAAQVEVSQSLAGAALPIPRVHWKAPAWTLGITAFADGMGDDRRLVGRYTLTNTARVPQNFRLRLRLRPFQVNPPQQMLNIVGGVSRIEALAWKAGALHVNGAATLVPVTPPGSIALQPFQGETTIGPPHAAKALAVTDPAGLASAELWFDATLAAGSSRDFYWVAPLGKNAPSRRVQGAEEAATRRWNATLGGVVLEGPPAARPVLGAIRTALGHILATREGPALRPGSRAYARSWIRDGAMMSTALLRMGLSTPPDRYLEWYAPYQYSNGKVPCCVDARGADPVPEHDSHGELIHLVAQLHRYAPDDARLRRMWPRVQAAADHIETLRQSTRVPANRTGVRRAFYGLLPPSISHEGYSAKPMHSYWDDFWGLTGLKDAAWLAEQAGRADEARLLGARADAFRADILASVSAAMAFHKVGFIPGAADLGDFDATSTTIALSPGAEMSRLPAAAVQATFERYWSEFEARRTGTKAWDAYTPYEWRNVGAFVRLGWRDRTKTAVDFFMNDRRPAGWNQWAEVVGRDAREPRFLGDMPHGWVASDFINAALDMIAYERDGALVIAAGVPRSWLEGGGIVIERLATPHGRLTLRFDAQGRAARLAYSLDGTPPPGGLVFGWPGAEGSSAAEGTSARIAGRAVPWGSAGIALPGRSGRLEFKLRAQPD